MKIISTSLQAEEEPIKLQASLQALQSSPCLADRRLPSFIKWDLAMHLDKAVLVIDAEALDIYMLLCIFNESHNHRCNHLQ